MKNLLQGLTHGGAYGAVLMAGNMGNSFLDNAKCYEMCMPEEALSLSNVWWNAPILLLLLLLFRSQCPPLENLHCFPYGRYVQYHRRRARHRCHRMTVLVIFMVISFLISAVSVVALITAIEMDMAFVAFSECNPCNDREYHSHGHRC